MLVRELMTADPEACTPKDTCDVAGEIMRAGADAASFPWSTARRRNA